MFAVQWFHAAPCVSYGWVSRGGTHSARGAAEADAHVCSWSDELPHRVVDLVSGRVVAVFAPSGKRLTFPIATAIAYAALAATAKREGARPSLQGKQPMMAEEQATKLGRRAIAAGWKWQAGALDIAGRRVVTCQDDAGDVRHADIWYALNGLTYYASQERFADVPDFRDPATLGILLAQVRERYDDPTIHAQFAEGSWRVAYWNPDNFYWAYWPEESFGAEAEALVAALEAAKEDKS